MASNRTITTLDDFINQRQKHFPYATGELTGLLRDIGVAAKIINREVNKAGLVNILGKDSGNTNSSGDQVQKLDMYANEKLINALKVSGECAGIASEENDDIECFPAVDHKESKYVVVFDPLDGSSNIDVNVTVGTIFGIYRRTSQSETCNLDDFLQEGNKLVASGYVVFGSSTILVYTTGHGVNGFTLDPSIGEFCLSHPNIKMPDQSQFYSVNQGYFKKFPREIRHFINHCSDKAMRLRYVGSMVADIHRTLIYGGLFIYPTLEGHPNGKLRLLYECNPLSMILEQAGGISIDCDFNRILDIKITDLHQKTGILMGSAPMIEEAMEIIAQFREKEMADI